MKFRLECLFFLCALSGFVLAESVSKVIYSSDFSNVNSIAPWNIVHCRAVVPIVKKWNPQNRSMDFCIFGTSPVITSIYVPIEIPIDVDKTIEIEMKYKYVGPKPMGGLAIISNGPGACAPAIKQGISFVSKPDWQDMKLVYNVAGLAGRKMIFELVLEGKICKGAVLSIGEIKIFPTPPLPVKAELFWPGSHQVFDKTYWQKAVIKISTAHKADLTLQAISEADKKIVADKKVCVDGVEKVEIDFTDKPVGQYQIILKSADGKYESKWDFEKLPYKANSVLIRNGIPYVNGKPRLVIGLFHSGELNRSRVNDSNRALGLPEITRDEMYAGIKERHFNTVFEAWRLMPAEHQQYLVNKGFMCLSELHGSAKPIMAAKKRVGTLGWYAIDEPIPSRSKEICEVYRQFKKADPYHPVMCALDNGGVGFDGRFIDVAIPDLYPIIGPESSVAESAMYVRNCIKYANHEDPTTCVWIASQLYTMNCGRHKGYEPRYEQVRAEVYTAIAAGAKGVVYYSWYTSEPLLNGMVKNPKRLFWFLPESRLWDRIGELNKELLSLEDMILLGKKSDKIKLDNKDCIWSCLEYKDEFYLIIVNPTARSPLKAQLKLENIAFQGNAIKSPKLEIENEDCRINLPAYGIGVYKFK